MADASALTDEPDQSVTFSMHRDLLVGLAYRMLGSVHDAEDVVQDAWLRWAEVDAATVADPRSFLIKVTSRLAIDRLRKLQVQRAFYSGSWLPEPILISPDAGEGLEKAESLSMAMMVVLETLSPLERAVFVLREAFDFGYSEIAETLGRSESAIRQLAHRARDHVTDRQPRFAADHATLYKATAKFMNACVGGDMTSLLEILSPSVELVADSGGVARAPRRVILGQDKIARFLVTTWQNAGLDDPAVWLAELNASPAVIVTSAGVPISAFMLEVADSVVQKVYLVANPDKLTHLAQAQASGA
jgi:RNA polymerase sigma-70 factor, ECF subfamily